jgi:hypothetical protein
MRVREESGRDAPDTPPDDDPANWSLTGVSESNFSTHRVAMDEDRPDSELRVEQQPFQRPDPSTLNVSAQEDKLRKTCADLATEVAYALQDRGRDVAIRDVHAAAKQRFKKSQGDMSLRLLKQKKQWLQRCLRAKRLI